MIQGLSIVPVLVAAVDVRTDRRIVKDLRSAGAAIPERSIELRTSSIRSLWPSRLKTADVVHWDTALRWYPNNAGRIFYRRLR